MIRNRIKESESDYLYLPERDLGKIRISDERIFNSTLKLKKIEEEVASLRKIIPYTSDNYSDFLIYRDWRYLVKLFNIGGEYFVDDLNTLKKIIVRLSAGNLLEIIRDSSSIDTALIFKLLKEGKLHISQFSQVSGGEGLSYLINSVRNSDSNNLAEMVESIISKYPGDVKDYLGGNTKALNFLVGKCIGELRGFNGNLIRETLIKVLSDKS